MIIFNKIVKFFRILRNKTWRKGIIHNIAANIELESLIKNLEINTFFDIGSNKGQFILLVDGLFKNKKIYSVEPIKELYLKQKKFFGNNKNISFFNYGIGSENKQKNLFITNRVDSSSFLQTKLSKKNSDYKIMQKREISIKTLDSLFSTLDLSKPSLIKIDVQGYELEVLKGGIKFLKKIDYILIEVSDKQLYLGQALETEIETFLSDISFYKIDENLPTVITDYGVIQKDILFKNNKNNKNNE